MRQTLRGCRCAAALSGRGSGLGRERKLATTAFASHDAVKNNIADVEIESIPAATGTGPAGLEYEFRLMRDEFAQLRELMLDREKKGRMLIEGYRNVIADFADLFETQRKDYIKRDESLRFFLNSIEGRLKTDIRNAIFGRENKGRGWWPFRRSR